MDRRTAHVTAELLYALGILLLVLAVLSSVWLLIPAALTVTTGFYLAERAR